MKTIRLLLNCGDIYCDNCMFLHKSTIIPLCKLFSSINQSHEILIKDKTNKYLRLSQCLEAEDER